MRKALSVLILIFIAIQMAGCATVTTGPTQVVSITSTPSEANVETDSGYKGITPTNFKLERKRNHIVKISKEGYKKAQVVLTKTMCGSTVGNVLIGGIIGIGIDAMTGAMFKLVPENIHVDLEKGDSSETVTVDGQVAKKAYDAHNKKEDKKKDKAKEEPKSKGTEISTR